MDQIQKSFIIQEKIAKFELSHQKKVIDECSSTLEFFLLQYVHISFFFKIILYLVLQLRIH